jgi:hypothetical protein
MPPLPGNGPGLLPPKKMWVESKLMTFMVRPLENSAATVYALQRRRVAFPPAFRVNVRERSGVFRAVAVQRSFGSSQREVRESASSLNIEGSQCTSFADFV